jgi:hypothetical protein
MTNWTKGRYFSPGVQTMKILSNGLVIGAMTMASVLGSQAAQSAEQLVWRAGTAKGKITPAEPFWMAGFASRTKPAEGTLHDLWVKALALEDGRHQRAVVITTDLVGFPKKVADWICDHVEKECGLQRSQIMLTCSHTHSGPVLKDALLDVYPLDDKQRAMIDQYTPILERTVVKTVTEAFAQMTPATLAVGMGECGFAVNRRNNVEKEVAAAIAQHKPLKGPVDHSVPVLAVRRADGRLQAVLFQYACHNTVLTTSYLYSGDYAGFAQIALEEKHPDCLAMFAIGCGADQNGLPRGTVEICQKYGNDLAAGVEAVLAQPMKPVGANLHSEFEIINLGFEGNLTVEKLLAAADKGGFYTRAAKHVLQRMLELKAQGKELPQSYPYPVQVWRLGTDQLWIALGGEVVVDYALSLRAKYGPRTWVFGYSNDVMAYIPSSRVWAEGGYESGAFNVYFIAAERWCHDIETRIKAEVERLVARSKSVP